METGTIILIIAVSLVSACAGMGAYHLLVVRPQAKKQTRERDHEERELDLMLRL